MLGYAFHGKRIPDVTRNKMAMELAGFDIRKAKKRGDIDILCAPGFGPLYLSSWETFLEKAKPEQIAKVKRALSFFPEFEASKA